MLKLREDKLAWREVDGETLLLDLEASMYLSVNPSATVLWRLLAEGTTRDALIDALEQKYSIARDRAAGDVDEFLNQCQQRGFITEADG